VEPVLLPPNQLHRFYRGGERISSLRMSNNSDPYAPEEWIASMASPFGEPGVGLSPLPDGRSLRDAVIAEAEAFLGSRHRERFGADVAVLIKLLDAGERLPVHLHPDDEFAQAHLGSAFGKTEAWIILEAEPGAAVHVGFRQPVDLESVASWVDSQDAEAMLSTLNRFEVASGDTIFVPARTPHAIGKGILLAEVQQPTDFSVLLEWKGFAADREGGHLGLGFDIALRALDLRLWSDEDLTRARSGRGSPRDGVETLFPPEADAFFRAERVGSGAHIEQGFAVLLVTGGRGELRGDGWKLEIAKGDAVLVPFAAGSQVLEGQVEALRCMPPAPDRR
jgi:mannose-6-phosphate isomerase